MPASSVIFDQVVADYEMAIHNAVKAAICSNINIQGCFYHLTQSTWRRVQAEGLQTLYCEDKEVRQFCGMLDELTFLPLCDVKEGMRILRKVASDNLMSLIEYFDTTYVNGAFRSVLSQNGTMKFRRTAPRFKPETWNVHYATMNGMARTNNVCEGWNNGFGKLVGHVNPSLWTVIQCLNNDAAMVEADILRHQMGQLVTKRRKRVAMNHQKMLVTLSTQYIKKAKSLSQFIYAIGANIRIVK